MNHAEHIESAQAFLRGEAILTEAGLGMLAAEAIWGATVQVVNAVNHARGRRAHANNNRERSRVIDYLADKYRVPDLDNGFRTARRLLHNHFYGGNLSESRLTDALELGRTFIATMIELAALEAADTERAERAPDAEQSESASNASPPI